MALHAYLLAIDTPVVRLDDNETLASNVQSSALDLLDAIGALVLVRSDDLLHLLR